MLQITPKQDSLFCIDTWKTLKKNVVIFAKREYKIQYSEKYLGLVWHILEPFFALIIYYVFFGYFLKIQTSDTPFVLFIFTGIISWFFFTRILSDVSVSLHKYQSILGKMPLNKLSISMSGIYVNFIEYLFALFILIIGIVFWGYYPSAKFIYIPALIVLIIISGYSIGIWIASLSIRYHDIHVIAPFVFRFAIWITPVFYPVSIIPENFKFILYINPMVLAIESYRWILFNTPAPEPCYFFSVIPVLILFFSGLIFFNKQSYKFVDIL